MSKVQVFLLALEAVAWSALLGYIGWLWRRSKHQSNCQGILDSSKEAR